MVKLSSLSTNQIKRIANRIAKCVGHAKVVRRMVEEGRDCSEVLIQLSAVRGEVTSAGKEILKDYMETLFEEATAEQDPNKIQELSKVVEYFLE